MKTILAIVGSAPNTLGDLYGFLAGYDIKSDIMAIGLDAVKLINGDVKYVVTNHLEDITEIRRRLNSIGCFDFILVSPLPGAGVDIVEPYSPPIGRSGSSAMTGTLAAIRIGYENIVLCGCPLTGNAPEGNPYEAFRLGWEDRQDEVFGKVKSMSGWTRGFLGGPTEEWLNG